MNEQEARKRWPYLFRPEFAVRQEKAHELAAGLDIVEIGPGPNPTQSDGEYLAVEELVGFDPLSVKRPYALVVLGIDIEGGIAAMDVARTLARGAQILIVEVNRNYEPGIRQMESLLAVAPGAETYREDLNIGRTPQGQRTMVAKGVAQASPVMRPMTTDSVPKPMKAAPKRRSTKK